MTSLERKSVITSVEEAASFIKDGMTVCFGGYLNTLHPMAILREVIKRKVKNLNLVAAGEAGLEVDLLIGAGCAKRVLSTYVGGETLCPIGPFFRAMAQRGEIEVREYCDNTLYAGLDAAGKRLPYQSTRAGVGTSFPEINPDLKPYNDPIKGEPLIAVPAIDIDVAIFHAACADAYGNVQYEGPAYSDILIWRAASKVIVQAEKIVSNEEIRRKPERTTMWSVNAVVRAPFGSHPYSCPSFYLEDREHIKEYVDAANAYLRENNRAPFEAYLDKYIRNTDGHLGYLDKIGLKKLFSLSEY